MTGGVTPLPLPQNVPPAEGEHRNIGLRTLSPEIGERDDPASTPAKIVEDARAAQGRRKQI